LRLVLSDFGATECDRSVSSRLRSALRGATVLVSPNFAGDLEPLPESSMALSRTQHGIPYEAAIRLSTEAVARKPTNFRSMTACIAVAVITTACAHFASRPGPVASDRPGYSDAPTVLPVGALQLESGYTYDHAGDQAYQSLGETLLRVGVLRGVELRGFGNSYAFREIGNQRTRGMEDAKLGAKFTLLDADTANAALPQLAAEIATTLPSGSTEFSAGKAVPEAKIVANWNAPHGLSLLVNAAMIDLGQTVGPARLAGSTALWYAAAPKASMFVEVFSAASLHAPGDNIRSSDIGATYLVADRTQLDLRFGTSVGTYPVERFVGFGFSRRW
jgi:hypothetical protein